MKILCLADLQAQSLQIKPAMLPEADMLLIAGDLGGWGTIQELEDCNTWLGTLPYKYKIIVGGNHDRELEDIDGHTLFTNATYLQDELVEIEGIKIYGSPVNEMNNLIVMSLAFSNRDYIKQVVKKIPEGLDILLTHGGCYGILDVLKYSQESVGSRDLLEAVLKKKPKHHVFGHIHESHGIEKNDDTMFINAAICSELNVLFRKDGSLYFDPIVITI